MTNTLKLIEEFKINYDTYYNILLKKHYEYVAEFKSRLKSDDTNCVSIISIPDNFSFIKINMTYTEEFVFNYLSYILLDKYNNSYESCNYLTEILDLIFDQLLNILEVVNNFVYRKEFININRYSFDENYSIYDVNYIKKSIEYILNYRISNIDKDIMIMYNKRDFCKFANVKGYSFNTNDVKKILGRYKKYTIEELIKYIKSKIIDNRTEHYNTCLLSLTVCE